jgi:abequosyltransferase
MKNEAKMVYENKIILSICIATFQRRPFLKDTLIEILRQTSKYHNLIQVVVADGGSTDGTKELLKGFEKNNTQLKVVYLVEKGGMDKDYDCAVRSGDGKYCWLLSDDDIIEGDAVLKVMNKLQEEKRDVLIVNSSSWDKEYSKCFTKRCIEISEDVEIKNENFHDKLFEICGGYVSFLGVLIIKKELWEQVDTQKFYGSRFIHLGVLSKIPYNSSVLIIKDSLIKIRLGNEEWNKIAFGIWFKLWPNIINEFSGIRLITLEQIVQTKTVLKAIKLISFHRALGSFNVRAFKYFDKNQKLLFSIALLVFLIPKVLWRYFYYIIARIRKNETLYYHMRMSTVLRHGAMSNEL